MISIILATIYEMLFGRLTESTGPFFMIAAMIEFFFIYPALIVSLIFFVGWKLGKKESKK